MRPTKPWRQDGGQIDEHVKLRNAQCLAAYRENPLLVVEHANIERATAQGGYGRRQIYELVQNGADALLGHGGGRIHVILTANALYCANQGRAIDTDGVNAIMTSHISWKRGAEIGRFGLGFKSVLGISSRPEFYSRSGCFYFSAAESEERIRSVVPNAERYPSLRLAWPSDPVWAAAEDGCLRELMEWATSVVRLPLDAGSKEWLTQELRQFPPEFALFCPHVAVVVLEDRTDGWCRELHVRYEKGLVVLEESGDAAHWKVLSRTYHPSDAARAEAGELADRDELPLMWAVPVRGRIGRGRFWAFFPTEYYTTLSGIVNAPWKTNEDRQNLLTGTFNEEMLDEVAQLVASSIPELTEPDDPGRFLDLLPARGREAPNWADEYLTEAVYRAAACSCCLPDQDGQLRRPGDVELHPAGLPTEALEIWASNPDRPKQWCHRSVDGRERRSRSERLFTLGKRQPASMTQWLEALAGASPLSSSSTAVQVAGYLMCNLPPAQSSAVNDACILLTQDGSLAKPDAKTVYLASDGETVVEGLRTVHSALMGDAATVEALRSLGIREIDGSSELEAFLARHPMSELDEAGWVRFWRITRRCDTERAKEIVLEHCDGKPALCVRARVLTGSFHFLHRVLLSGQVVPGDGSRDADVTLDEEYHKDDIDILRAFGAVPAPVTSGGSLGEPWEGEYDAYAYRCYAAAQPADVPVPRRNNVILYWCQVAGPLEPLCHLSEEGRARFTEALLLASEDDRPWHMQRDWKRHAEPVYVEPPSLWMAKRDGRLRSSLGVRRVAECVGPGLSAWRALMPVADCSDHIAGRLGLPSELEGLTADHWQMAFDRAVDCGDIRLAGGLYACASEVVDAPEAVLCVVGTELVSKCPEDVVTVVHEPAAAALRSIGQAYLPVPSDAAASVLVDRWGMRRSDETVTLEVRRVASGPEVPLVDMFPDLAIHGGERAVSVLVVPCASIRVETVTSAGHQSEEREWWLDGDRFYFLAELPETAILDAACGELGIQLPASDRAQILEHRALTQRRERISRIRQCESLSEKLLVAIGESRIRRRIAGGLMTAAAQRYGILTPQRVAELAHAVYGVETLHAYRDELSQAELCPPLQWAGSFAARRFVRDLGFPKEYAGFQQSRREAVLVVDGPPNLPPLHGFQEAIVGRIGELFSGKRRSRGLLSLPTGAGKTRVVVEALVRLSRDNEPSGPVLWVAQSDELCEQTVQTWSDVWRGIGPPRPLHVNRLWAANEAEPYGEGAQVVVATIQKLQGCFDDRAYEWLSEPACLVIDEAHMSIGPSYTALLQWHGMERGKERCPLIGLTATPFRGGEEETTRLVRRYDGCRLDEGVLGEDPYAELQRLRVLSEVDHELLSGSDVELRDAELEELRRTSRLPASAGERIGADAGRNEILLHSVASRDLTWPILLFAASVEHARTMAALLCAEGISAAAVSAETDAGARRHYIERFRRGDLRVLANYGVLTAGFDAPAVRAVYVARPTFSPVLYQQMIGRGLRGPLNGGKERCLIVNVKDNFRQYGEDLAFRGFEHLWAASGERG